MCLYYIKRYHSKHAGVVDLVVRIGVAEPPGPTATQRSWTNIVFSCPAERSSQEEVSGVGVAGP